MKEMVVLNKKEQRRLVVLNQVEEGRIGGREAGEVSGLSLRHVRRLGSDPNPSSHAHKPAVILCLGLILEIS